MAKRERTKKKGGDRTLFLGKHGFYLKLSGAWDLLLQSLAAGPISSAASPSPGCIPFDQAWSSARKWLSPFSLHVLKLVGGCLCSHFATTRGNEGSFVHWHLIWSGSVQWSPQISPGPSWVCVCVCFSASSQPPTVDKTVRILWSNIKAIRWRVNEECFFFLLLLLLQHMLAVGETIKCLEQECSKPLKFMNSMICGYCDLK